MAPEALWETARAEAARLRALDMPSYEATKERVCGDARASIQSALMAELGATATA